jgi:hypothetical protein
MTAEPGGPNRLVIPTKGRRKKGKSACGPSDPSTQLRVALSVPKGEAPACQPKRRPAFAKATVGNLRSTRREGWREAGRRPAAE